MDSEADYAKENELTNDDQENQKSSPMNSIVAKYREKQQAALDAATREAQLIRERSTDLSPSKGSGSESRSESKSPEKETKPVSDEVAEPAEVEVKIPEPVEDPKQVVEEETQPEEAPEPEPEPVVEKEKEPEVEKVEEASVEAQEPSPVPEIELESSQDSQEETTEVKGSLEKEQAEEEKDSSKEESQKEEDKRSESGSRSRSPSAEAVREERSSPEKRATPAEAGDGDYLELDYEEEAKAEATEKDVTEKERSESEVQSPKDGDLDNERPKEKKPYVEDRFDFLKKISASEPETKETTEYGLVRANPPSPARHDVDLFIHVHRLRRPFTNKGLIALLKKFGEFDENEDFWIDAIKSNCIVKYSSIEEAKKARQELHNVIWPTGNPDCLLVDFCTEDRFIEKKVGKVEKKKEVKPEESIRVEVETAPIEHHEPPTTSEEKNGADEDRERKRTPTRQKSEKGLDELFKKTNAKPFIYYLPLSTEEAERKWADRKALEEKRRHRETPPIRSRPTPSRRRSPPPRRRRSISRSPDRKRDRRASPPRRR